MPLKPHTCQIVDAAKKIALEDEDDDEGRERFTGFLPHQGLIDDR